MMTLAPRLEVLDLAPKADDITADVVASLSQSPPQLPSKYFYDRRGSALFDEICEQPEYYLTRTEIDILRRRADDIADAIGPEALLVELGSGSSVKTRILLDALERPAGYVPVDISKTHLLNAAHGIAEEYPDLEVLPVCADYGQAFDVPAPERPVRRCVAFFPGSTLGNMNPQEATRFLDRLAEMVSVRCTGRERGGLLIGVDLVKSPSILVPAYSDAAGVTAAFNFNLLDRINREAGGDFDRDGWSHSALWNADDRRMESHLVSRRRQRVTVAGRTFIFDQGDTIRTETSHKYAIDGVARLARRFTPSRTWTDDRGWFSVQLLDAD